MGMATASPAFSCTLAGGQRYLLSASGADVTVSVQAPAVRPDGAPVSGVRSGYDALQVLFAPLGAPVVALRWFGDDGGCGGDGALTPDACAPVSG